MALPSFDDRLRRLQVLERLNRDLHLQCEELIRYREGYYDTQERLDRARRWAARWKHAAKDYRHGFVAMGGGS